MHFYHTFRVLTVRARLAFLPALLLFGLLLGLTGTARAATLVVTTLADDSSGSTLRDAIAQANTDGADDTITFSVTGTITLAQGTLNITAPMTIVGPGVALDGNHASTVITITGGTANNPVALSGLTIQNGKNSNFGGGVYNSGAATLTDCTLTENSATDGGGLYNDGTATLTGCTLTGNSALDDVGGGVFNGGTATLTDCTLTGNSATDGGGVLNSGTATLTDCTLTGNSAPYSNGGGVYNYGAATLTDCTLTGNSANSFGGGVFNYSGTATLTGCTLTGNSAADGGGVFNYGNYGGTATLTDDIFYNEPGNDIAAPGGTLNTSHCDISDGTDVGSNGNINADPQFVNAPSDLHLLPGSPCANAGVTVAGVTSDLDGRLRPSSPSMGAYEAAPTGAYSLIVTTMQDTVPQSLRTAVQCADDYPDAQISFDPAVFATAQTITETSGTLTLSQSMTLTAPAAGVAIDGNHLNTVFTITGGTTNDPVALIGLTIQNGQTSTYGGGVYNSGAATLTGCALIGNTANTGGGLYNDGANSTVTATLTACTITANSATFYGGGIFNNGAWESATLTLTGCTLTGNSANRTGGGLDNNGIHCTATLTDDILYGDTASSGGTEVENGGTLNASYCDIGDGTAVGSNGNINTDPQFVNAPYDLRVQVGSPVVGAGDPALAGTLDITGATRANPPTIGAYEGQKAATQTTLALANGSSALVTPGTSVSFTATVTNTSPGSSAVPTGSVQLLVNYSNVGSPVALTGGTATLTDIFATSGVYQVTAVYIPATGNVSASASNGSALPLTETVDSPPTLTVPANITAEATGPSGASVSFAATATDDLDPSPAITYTVGGSPITSPNTFPLGVTTVSVTAANKYGQTSTTPFTVTVQDTTPPTFSGSVANITAPATGPSGAVVSFTLPTATDLVDGSVTVKANYTSGSVFPVGMTTVTYTATDAHNNTATGTFTVTVTAQKIAPPPIVVAAPDRASLPNTGKTVPVSVAGLALDLNAGLADSGSYTVADSEGQVHPSGTFRVVPLLSHVLGLFGFTVDLPASCQSSDKTGRKFTITVTVPDRNGVPGTTTVVVTVPHGKR